MELLVEVGVLVDKYGLLEAVELMGEIWIAALVKGRGGLPLTLEDDLMDWIWVTWVFQKGEEFRHVTRVMERESNCEIQAESLLPIPTSIIGNHPPKVSYSIC